MKEISVLSFNSTKTLKGKEFEGTVLAHPLNGNGYEHEVLLLEADFVTTDQGTGFVHIAPGHGADDLQEDLRGRGDQGEDPDVRGHALDHEGAVGPVLVRGPLAVHAPRGAESE